MYPEPCCCRAQTSPSCTAMCTYGPELPVEEVDTNTERWNILLATEHGLSPAPTQLWTGKLCKTTVHPNQEILDLRTVSDQRQSVKCFTSQSPTSVSEQQPQYSDYTTR
ncbi:hypothetical protein BaRGS_00006038 [Batillaria attramentaria]|uniref:Uncharacterized protein n=1 Tax=Batillaria attramentaria TaxID=370345 RepID=A0ABD0LUK3_9CAEN